MTNDYKQDIPLNSITILSDVTIGRNVNSDTLDVINALHTTGNSLTSFVNTSLPDDIRAKGWMVAVHNDYKLNGVSNTFWLFTKDHNGTTIAVKGEGVSDSIALNKVREQITKLDIS